MKLEEAIKIIKQNFPKRCERVNGILKGGFDDKESPYGQALTLAIEALEEVQQYRPIKDATIREIVEVLKEFSEIGTAEERWEAVKRQKPKKAIKSKERCKIVHRCQECKKVIYNEHGMVYAYCPNCGSKIDWSEEDE